MRDEKNETTPWNDWDNSQSRRSVGVNGTASSENKATQVDFFLLKLVYTHSLHFSPRSPSPHSEFRKCMPKKSYTSMGEGFVSTTFQGELWKPSGNENVSHPRRLLSQGTSRDDLYCTKKLSWQSIWMDDKFRIQFQSLATSTTYRIYCSRYIDFAWFKREIYFCIIF